jgi:hypothetical protein
MSNHGFLYIVSVWHAWFISIKLELRGTRSSRRTPNAFPIGKAVANSHPRAWWCCSDFTEPFYTFIFLYPIVYMYNYTLTVGEIFWGPIAATASETNAANHILHKFKPLIGCENSLELSLGLFGVSHAKKRDLSLGHTDFGWQLGP